MKENKTLNFIGNGSCFNTDFGNNSAYYIDKEKKSLLLIDCGETVFERLMKECLGFDIARVKESMNLER